MFALLAESEGGLDTPSKSVYLFYVLHGKLIRREVCDEHLVAAAWNHESHYPETEFIVIHRNVQASSFPPHSVGPRHIMVVVLCAVSHVYVFAAEYLRSVVDVHPPGVFPGDYGIKAAILIAEVPVSP